MSPLGALGIDGRILVGLAGVTLAAVGVGYVIAAGLDGQGGQVAAIAAPRPTVSPEAQDDAPLPVTPVLPPVTVPTAPPVAPPTRAIAPSTPAEPVTPAPTPSTPATTTTATPPRPTTTTPAPSRSRDRGSRGRRRPTTVSRRRFAPRRRRHRSSSTWRRRTRSSPTPRRRSPRFAPQVSAHRLGGRPAPTSPTCSTSGSGSDRPSSPGARRPSNGCSG